MQKKSKKAFLILLLSTLTACSGLKLKRSDAVKKESSEKIEKEVEQKTKLESETVVQEEVVKEETVVEQKQPPKIGLILGAGGFKSFAYVGVLRELEKAKIPIDSIIGLEWGALVAALYAANGEVNDLEWQLLKLKKEDVLPNSLFGRSLGENSIQRMDEFLGKALQQKSLSQFQVPMSCPVQRAKKSMIWAEGGRAVRVLKRCLPYPPFFNATNEYASAIDLKAAVRRLKEQGIDIIVFVNAIKAGPLLEGNMKNLIVWQQTRKFYELSDDSIDEVVGMYLPQGGVDSFEQRKNYLRSGMATGRSLVQKLSDRYHF